MSRLLMVALALFGALLLASCATLTKEQCQAGDWRSIGFNDGSRGRPANYVSNHVDACAEYGISLDNALYQAGRSDGLGSYCRLSTAETTGRRGERYYGVCEGPVGAAFARVHRAGEAVYEAKSELSSLDSEIDGLMRQLRREGISEDEMRALSRQITSLQRSRWQLESEVRRAERSLASIRRAEEVRLAQAGIAY
ncbi:MAG TPA: DUF2799 domain-containing protein [Pelagibacterium sp.]|uniref:DUF2799 domain-containing protein n=1 Tax=Pelagibacterium sp. TaxID=1967288 RepID=UPI002C14D74C|nr:DUF2799 domain-containing protein [Pelagibacterium sp.]HWJ88071.1 DUF2799 domain-containing protein [Pelagibacterium sp.]